jgi:hypothetical protein
MSRRGLSKKASNLRHAKRRAQERYDLELTQSLHRRIVLMIQSHQTDRERKISNSRTEFFLTIDDHYLRVIYDKRTHSLITFLPLQAPRDGLDHALGELGLESDRSEA